MNWDFFFVWVELVANVGILCKGMSIGGGFEWEKA
jgi:hypothetical protein